MQVRWKAVLLIGGVLLSAHGGGDLASAQAASLDYFSVSPCRVLDTRSAGQGPALASGASRIVTVTGGTCGIPASARAIAANITSVTPTGLGNLRLYPGDGTVPPTSALNFGAGQTRANNGVFSLAGNGDGTLGILATVAASGSVHVVLDVTGYFAPFPEQALRQAVTARLNTGACVGQGTLGGGYDYCYANAGGCNPGCHMTLQVQTLQVTPAGPGRATVDVVFDVSGTIPLDGLCGTCNLNVLAAQQHLRSEVVYEFDAGTGGYTVTSETRSISPAFDNWQFSNCSLISCLVNEVDDLMNAVEGSILISGVLQLAGLQF